MRTCFNFCTFQKKLAHPWNCQNRNKYISHVQQVFFFVSWQLVFKKTPSWPSGALGPKSLTTNHRRKLSSAAKKPPRFWLPQEDSWTKAWKCQFHEEEYIRPSRISKQLQRTTTTESRKWQNYTRWIKLNFG
jgi:hypothetical protein